MLGNGTLTYDHDRDGRATELGGCTALVRNAIYDTFLLIRYSRNRLKACLCLSIYMLRRISTRLFYSCLSFQNNSLENKSLGFFVHLFCCHPADGECGWDAGMERMCRHLRTAFTYRILLRCFICHRRSFRYDTLTFASFQHHAGSDRSLHVIPTDFCAVLDNHDIISLKLYQLTVQKRAEEEEEEEVIIPRVDNINLFQGKNHPISIHLSDKAAVLMRKLFAVRKYSQVRVLCAAVEVQDEGMSGVQFFFTLLVSILGVGVLAVVGAVVYGRWKQNRRKRFY